jgi:nitroreductase
MGILKVIKNRRSVRDFTDRKIPDDALDALIDAIRWAPSAGNLQSRKFYFVFDEDLKKRLAGAAWNQNFIKQAPVAVVACINLKIARQYGERGVNLYCIQDASASIMNMLLMAQDLGLGTVWVGAFNESEVFKIMNLPDYLRPVAIVPIGYPAKLPQPTPRISKEAAVDFIR